MAGRYLVTGVQLGMILGLINKDEGVLAITELIEKILEKQFVGNSEQDIEQDVQKVQQIFE